MGVAACMLHHASNCVLERGEEGERRSREAESARRGRVACAPEAGEVGELLQDEDGAAEVEQVDLCAGQSTPNKGRGLRLSPSRRRDTRTFCSMRLKSTFSVGVRSPCGMHQ